MACSNPLYFLDLGKKENGARNLKLIPKRVDYNFKMLCDRYGFRNILQIPCGKCPSCIKAYRKQWSLRCEAEARCHDQNCYITLTLEKEYVKDGLQKKHLQKFFKALRDKGLKFRYFACGEYGELTSRPHYHAIIFGYSPNDLKYFAKSKSGIPMYQSQSLSDVWQKGFVWVQEFAPSAAGYVAGYVDKKLETKEGFLLMSNRPGIGAYYYRKNWMKLLENDNFISKNGHVSSLPRYFDKLMDQQFVDLSDIKEKRIAKAREMTFGSCVHHGFDNLEILNQYNELCAERRKKNGRVLSF